MSEHAPNVLPVMHDRSSGRGEDVDGREARWPSAPAAPRARPRAERALRPHQPRGEPRRGPRGVLFLRRLDADPRVHRRRRAPAGPVRPHGRPRHAADAEGNRSRRAMVREQVGEKAQEATMSTPRYPSLFQINTRVRLSELSAGLGRPATLDDVTDAELDQFARDGFDLVWFLGVWQTGEAARRVSATNPEWLAEYHQVLPDFRESDVCGSCFAVRDYHVHADFGGDDALARLRERLRARGLRLVLDFVPNHVAPDHPWVEEHPDFFIAGTEDRLTAEPQNYRRFETSRGSRILAYGRDPYFAGWPDTLQLNYGNPGLQDALLGELERIARQCDGVRCDMAMLVLPEVFETDVGDLCGSVLATGHGGRARGGPGIPVPRRGLLGPRVDAPAAGVRLHLRQAALRSPRARGAARRPRAPLRRARLPGPPRALPREPRRAARRRDVRSGRPPRSRRDHVPQPRPPLLPPGPARGKAGADPHAPGAGTGRGAGRVDRRLLRRAPRLPEGPGVPRRRVAAARRPSRLGGKRDERRVHRVLVDRVRETSAASSR